MARSGTRGQQLRGAQARGRVVDAAIEALRQRGFAGASAREIARIGGFAQGVVFYHFGTMDEVLLAALDRVGEQRMARYSAAVAAASTIPELVDVASGIYREDLEQGHLKVLAELIAASSSNPELGAAVADRIEPWVSFTAEVIERFLTGSPLATVVPVQDAAFAIVAVFLGVELLTTLDGNRHPADSLIRSAGDLGALLAPFIQPGPQEATP